jgi:hypothetical protein
MPSDAWQVPGRCLVDARKLHGSCQEAAWKL